MIFRLAANLVLVALFTSAACDNNVARSGNDIQANSSADCAPSEKWSKGLPTARGDIPELYVSIRDGHIVMADVLQLEGKGWEYTLKQVKDFEPKPFLILSVDPISSCDSYAASIRRISNAYECSPLKCFLIKD